VWLPLRGHGEAHCRRHVFRIFHSVHVWSSRLSPQS
jgi:hypothetical protein